MLKRFLLIGLAGALAAGLLAACGDDDGDGTGGQPDAYARADLLVETADLSAKLSAPGTVVVDLRKREDYDAGHIPGAVWYDRARLKGADDTLHVIGAEDFAAFVGRIGVANDSRVVAYDEGTGLWAARFWWVLDYYGHTNAAILNGGFAKWANEGREESKDEPTVAATTFRTNVNPAVICALDYVEGKSEAREPRVVILDVRSPAEYSGTDVRAAKGGHVPGAVNLDWSTSMTSGTPQVWKPAAELRKQFQDAGISNDVEVITYCQTAVRAAHSFFTLRLVGYGSVRNYDGSWAEWGNDKDTRVEK